ncbi:radical SAM protein [Neolewinella sp.]|uniref:SPL family radical SAM protein n=1 Tax=Neolewinella sp. TaxID=2993543 RepID=UPI003B518D2A
MPQLKRQRTKTLTVKDNGRSADYVTPNFIYGCLGGCRDSYCYVMRYNHDKVFINENTEQILDRIAAHAGKLDWPKRPNQTDATYYTYDIGCSTDIGLHYKHYDWERVFTFFRDHPMAKATFATKYVNDKLLDFDPRGKVRIRFSLMPQRMSDLVEPKTSQIADRIAAIPRFIAAGYDVHVNFSPIIFCEGWLEDYRELFEELATTVTDPAHRDIVQAEGIMVTHNPWQHERNLAAGMTESEALLWRPDIQEHKRSGYGSSAVRYRHDLKAQICREWLAVHDEVVPWNRMRYLF